MHKTYEFEDSHHLRSGKRYKVYHKGYFLEYYPSISESAKSNAEEREREREREISIRVKLYYKYFMKKKKI